MKRDNDLVRQLMFEFENEPDWLVPLDESLSMSEEDRRRQHHVHLLADAGLVSQVGRSTYRLTNSGHDYLEAVRDEGIWNKTKAAVAETGGSASLEIIKALALGFVRKKLAQHTGLEL